jgi:hypothetical protein
VALLIDAKDERVAKWYASYGAVPLSDAPLSLLFPLETIRIALEASGKLCARDSIGSALNRAVLVMGKLRAAGVASRDNHRKEFPSPIPGLPFRILGVLRGGQSDSPRSVTATG